jgi:hypothetical protein
MAQTVSSMGVVLSGGDSRAHPHTQAANVSNEPLIAFDQTFAVECIALIDAVMQAPEDFSGDEITTRGAISSS